MSEVTRILSALDGGDPRAAEQLLPLVYEELRRLAAQKLPRHLPRDRRVYELSAAERLCQGCGRTRVVIGQEVSEQLDYEPASLKVVEHIRLTHACPCCEMQRQAGAVPAPAAPPAPGTPKTGTASFSVSELTDTAATLPSHRPERLADLLPEEWARSQRRTAEAMPAG